MGRVLIKRVVSKYLIFLFLFLIGSSGIIFYLTIPDAPVSEIREARENLADAREAHADRYAPKQFSQANALYDSAMAVWQLENQKFILFRDYSKVRSYSGESSKISLAAVGQARNNARNARQQTGETFESLKERVKHIAALYGNLPLSDKFRENFNQAKLLLEETRIARSKHEFHKAGELLERAEKALDIAGNMAESRMKSYFEDYPAWKSAYEKALAASAAAHSPLVVVDKLARELKLYKDGKLRQTFTAEFGPNWLGDKNHQGDQATPEGTYLVLTKKERRQTRYYKALLLNYPNKDDMQRYKNNVKNGVIPKNIDVGGLIEIHGHGGQGFNWTNGCVALTDKEMDVLYRQVSVNTPVIIVGSLVSYQEWQDQATGRN
jgi:hypothetical protein